MHTEKDREKEATRSSRTSKGHTHKIHAVMCIKEQTKPRGQNMICVFFDMHVYVCF